MELFRKYAFIFILLANWQPLVVVNGLECDICDREGNLGSRSCDPMPCNTWKDVMAAERKLIQIRFNKKAVEEFDIATKKGLNQTTTNNTRCIKVVGQVIRYFNQNPVPHTRVSCAPVASAYPPNSTAYTSVPSLERAYRTNGVKLENYLVYICDEKLEDKCRVTWEELNRSGANSRGAASVIMITTFVLAALFGARHTHAYNLI